MTNFPPPSSGRKGRHGGAHRLKRKCGQCREGPLTSPGSRVSPTLPQGPRGALEAKATQKGDPHGEALVSAVSLQGPDYSSCVCPLARGRSLQLVTCTQASQQGRRSGHSILLGSRMFSRLCYQYGSLFCCSWVLPGNMAADSTLIWGLAPRFCFQGPTSPMAGRKEDRYTRESWCPACDGGESNQWATSRIMLSPLYFPEGQAVF
jgi:hypothetical protein